MFYNLSNLDIKMLYIENEFSNSNEWMHNFFVQTKFFAEHRVKKYLKNFPREDLIQESYLGLWCAIITYDYQKNFDFYRWAQWNISKKIRDYFKSQNKYQKTKSNIKNTSYSYDEWSKLEVEMFVKQVLSKENKILSDREKYIVKNVLLEGKTLTETAKSLDISIERVRQIKNHSFYKINKI